MKREQSAAGNYSLMSAENAASSATQIVAAGKKVVIFALPGATLAFGSWFVMNLFLPPWLSSVLSLALTGPILLVAAIVLTAINMFGGFAVTQRMLAMFRR